MKCELKEENSDTKQNPVENTLAFNESTKEEILSTDVTKPMVKVASKVFLFLK